MKTQKSLDGTFWLREMMLENVSGGGKETLKITVKASEHRGGAQVGSSKKNQSSLHHGTQSKLVVPTAPTG
jgi:hypothetical protein